MGEGILQDKKEARGHDNSGAFDLMGGVGNYLWLQFRLLNTARNQIRGLLFN